MAENIPVIDTNASEWEVRNAKLAAIREEGIAYKQGFARTHKLHEAAALPEGTKVAVCGRLVSKRVLGKLIFAHLYDAEGKLQFSLSKGDYPDDFQNLRRMADVGDYIGITGEMYVTKVGEVTVRAESIVILSKSLRPLPEKFHGMTDLDLKYRQRYLDMVSNDESRKVFLARSKVVSEIRRFLEDRGFMEVETPILQAVATGANARPFMTHHNSLDQDFYLRIAPELFLKQVIAGGVDRVFEIGKNFRNEGMDASHLQEFTMIEWYAAYWDYEENIRLITDLMRHLCRVVTGSEKITFQGLELDFGNIVRMDYTARMNEIFGMNILDAQDVQELKDAMYKIPDANRDEIKDLPSIPAAIDYAFKRWIRPWIVQPTIMDNYPACLIPLARRNDKDDRLIDMFQLVVNGWEMCKCYSELVDPVVQREAFEEQMKLKTAGDDEAMSLDEDFLLAMEHGMPPMSGLGMGIDRLVCLLCDQPTLRDVVLFPTMKPTNTPKKAVEAPALTAEQQTLVEEAEEEIDFSHVTIEPLFSEFVDFETFSKSDFRAVKVLACEAVKKSKKLLQFTLDDGTGTSRTILSGIHAFYEPEELVGKTLIAITNLPPRPMMGIESCGMLLSAIHSENGEERLNLLMVDKRIPAGAKLY